MINVQFRHGHIKALDGLRGLAILLVLLYHCGKSEIFPLNYLIQIGWVGVDLFFALSGFLITGILMDTRNRPNYLSSFLLRRSLRIFPLYYLALGIFFLAAALGWLAGSEFYIRNQLFFWFYLQNILFAFQGWPEQSYLTHFWSLAIEEQFYLFWPAVIFFLTENQIVLVCILLVLVAIVIRNVRPENPYYYVFTLARIDTLCIGAVGAIVIRKWPRVLSIAAPFGIMSAAAALLFMFSKSSSLDFSNPYFYKYGYDLFAVFFVGIICLCFDTGVVGRSISIAAGASPFRLLGRYSYGVYVYHWPLYLVFFSKLPAGWNEQLRILIFLSAVLCISALSYHAIESRFLRLKQRFS